MVTASVVGAVSAPLLTGLAGARVAIAPGGLAIASLALARAYGRIAARGAIEPAWTPPVNEAAGASEGRRPA